MSDSTAIRYKGADSATPRGRCVDRGLLSTLDALQAPLYVVDARGAVTHFNKACIDFIEQRPEVGAALRARHPAAGIPATMQRKDGSWANVLPLPTPIIGSAGELLGTVNLLIDVTDLRQIDALRSQAQ